MERQRREEELKTRSSKKGQEAEQSILNRVCFLFCLFNYISCALYHLLERKKKIVFVVLFCADLVYMNLSYFVG